MRKRRKVRRLLYRSYLTNDEVDRLIAAIGLRRMLEAFDRLSGPDHSFKT